MKPMALYPSEGTLKKTAGTGAGLLFVAYQFSTWFPDGASGVALLLAVVGVGLIGQAGLSYLRPSPTFEADADGFSIMGKKKRDWDTYRGVSVRTMRVGFFAVSRTVVIKTGKSVLGRRIQIRPTHLSAPAAEMAHDIDQYAKHAQRKVALIEALSGMPAQDIVSATRSPTPIRPVSTEPVHPELMPTKGRPFSKRLTEAEGPVRSVPGLGERLFGRRKVL